MNLEIYQASPEAIKTFDQKLSFPLRFETWSSKNLTDIGL